jgi:hypothetical protein
MTPPTTLVGYRTYIIAIMIIVQAVGAFLTGDMTLAEAVNAALLGTGLGALRAGVSAEK